MSGESATTDACGVCDAVRTMIVQTARVRGGRHLADACGACDTDPNPSKDCAMWGGSATTTPASLRHRSEQRCQKTAPVSGAVGNTGSRGVDTDQQ